MNINRPEWICTLCGFILKENSIAPAANALTRMPQLADDVICPDCCAPSNLFTLSLCVLWLESHGGRVAVQKDACAVMKSAEKTSATYSTARLKAQSQPFPIEFRKRKIGCYG